MLIGFIVAHTLLIIIKKKQKNKNKNEQLQKCNNAYSSKIELKMKKKTKIFDNSLYWAVPEYRGTEDFRKMFWFLARTNLPTRCPYDDYCLSLARDLKEL